MIQALPGLHSFTGCDTTSALVRRGKRRPFDIVVADSLALGRTARCYGYMAAFQLFGSAGLEVSNEDIGILERFVCTLYGKTGSRFVNKLRYDIFRSRYDSKKNSIVVQNGIDMSLLPPCFSSLQMHCSRAAFQAFVWKHAHENFPNIPSPDGHGWKMANGVLTIDWFACDMLPVDLADLLIEKQPDDENISDVCQQFDGSEVEEDDEVDNIIDVLFDEDDDL